MDYYNMPSNKQFHTLARGLGAQSHACPDTPFQDLHVSGKLGHLLNAYRLIEHKREVRKHINGRRRSPASPPIGPPFASFHTALATTIHRQSI